MVRPSFAVIMPPDPDAHSIDRQEERGVSETQKNVSPSPSLIGQPEDDGTTKIRLAGGSKDFTKPVPEIADFDVICVDGSTAASISPAHANLPVFGLIGVFQ
jgi:hypothetical protein